MIKKIYQVKDIAGFKDFSQTKDFQYGENNQNCNIIFGQNGAGKTTISNIFSLFSDESFISEKDKEELFGDIKRNDQSTVELELQGGTKIKYPASKKHSKSILVFNSNFISSHVFNGTKAKIRKFSNISGEIKNKEITRLAEEIDVKTKQVNELEIERKRLEDEFDRITREKSEEFKSSLTDKGKRLTSQVQKLTNLTLPTQTRKECLSELENLKKDYDLSKKQAELNTDLEIIRGVDVKQIQIEITDINELLTTSIKKLSREVMEQKIRQIQELFDDRGQKENVEGWFAFGGKLLKSKYTSFPILCPICDTDISEKIGHIIDDFEGFFDQAYDDFIVKIESMLVSLNMQIDRLEKISDVVAKIETIRRKYAGVITQNKEVTLETKPVINELKTIIESLIKKKKNIQLSIEIGNLIECQAFNNKVMLFRKFIEEIKVVLESKSLDTHKIEDEIRGTFNKIIIIEFNEASKSGALQSYKDNFVKLVTLTQDQIPLLKEQLKKELGKVKAESRGISKYLKLMGVNNFSIDINEGETENVIIRYTDVSGEKYRLKNTLSDGEKTAVAFAYFLSKYENEINTDEKTKETTVIIDDPISSLDENRLYSTAYLIKSKFENVKQLVVLSHNFLFLKYFNSFFKGKKRSNCFYLEKNILSPLPEELKNFESPYFYMLKQIQSFVLRDVNIIKYDDAKRYLPNYIRRVLETFLSFRFATLSSSRGAAMSPGLLECEEILKKTDIKHDLVSQLSELIAEVNHVCDVHSHGNAHHTQESFYISENDLLSVSKKALEIIDKLEGLKFNLRGVDQVADVSQ